MYISTIVLADTEGIHNNKRVLKKLIKHCNTVEQKEDLIKKCDGATHTYKATSYAACKTGSGLDSRI